MKLKDLKPNDCIVINSRKEAKQLRKLFENENVKSNIDSSSFCINDVGNLNKVCISSHSNKLWFSHVYGVYKKEYSVKDFLPKKSKFKKDVSQELARLDNLTNYLSIRLSAFELNNFGKVDNTLTPETLKAITEPVTSPNKLSDFEEYFTPVKLTITLKKD